VLWLKNNAPVILDLFQGSLVTQNKMFYRKCCNNPETCSGQHNNVILILFRISVFRALHAQRSIHRHLYFYRNNLSCFPANSSHLMIMRHGDSGFTIYNFRFLFFLSPAVVKLSGLRCVALFYDSNSIQQNPRGQF